MRSVTKTFSWRGIYYHTILISRYITGSWTAGLSIGIIEVFTKMILYYFHEKAWSASDWGLDGRTPQTSVQPLRIEPISSLLGEIPTLC